MLKFDLDVRSKELLWRIVIGERPKPRRSIRILGDVRCATQEAGLMDKRESLFDYL